MNTISINNNTKTHSKCQQQNKKKMWSSMMLNMTLNKKLLKIIEFTYNYFRIPIFTYFVCRFTHFNKLSTAILKNTYQALKQHDLPAYVIKSSFTIPSHMCIRSNFTSKHLFFAWLIAILIRFLFSLNQKHAQLIFFSTFLSYNVNKYNWKNIRILHLRELFILSIFSSCII